MNTKQLIAAAGLLFLATACKEDNTVKPSYVAPAVSSPAQVVDEIVDDDSVYTTEGKGKPVKLKIQQETPTPKQDVMPTDLQSEM